MVNCPGQFKELMSDEIQCGEGERDEEEENEQQQLIKNFIGSVEQHQLPASFIMLDTHSR